jgi:hypothetical protein
MLNKKIPTLVGVLIIVFLAGLVLGVLFLFQDIHDSQFLNMVDEGKKLEDEKHRTVEDFIPENWEIIAKTEGDLNEDGLTDMAIVIEDGLNRRKEMGHPYLCPDWENPCPRSLLILFQKEDGGYELSIKNDNVIMLSNEGGIWGDPFEGIEVDRGSLVIYFYGGSSSRWSLTYRFRFQDDGWYLIGKTESSYRTSDPETFLDEDYNYLTGYMERTTSANSQAGVKEGTDLIYIGKEDLLNLKDFDTHFNPET